VEKLRTSLRVCRMTLASVVLLADVSGVVGLCVLVSGMSVPQAYCVWPYAGCLTLSNHPNLLFAGIADASSVS
jgi:predicted short-subunit dehydrogenase-like oxidoreductase (DUF2520 family)